MKEKNQTSENSKLIEPFINLILFDSNDFPNFDKSYFEKLSEKYLKCRNDCQEDKEPTESTYFIEKLELYFRMLSVNDREKLSQIIVKNELVVETLFMNYVLDNKIIMDLETEDNERKHFFSFLIELIKFKIDGKVNKYSYFYFALLFQQIFYFEISKKEEISLLEYENIVEHFSQFKFLN